MSMSGQKWVSNGFGQLQVRRVTLREPGAGQLTIAVRAVGMNPVDAINLGNGVTDIGYEVSGAVMEVGAGVTTHAVGDPVLAFRVQGGYSTVLSVSASDALRKPAGLGWAEAANLLLAGSAAAEMLYRTKVVKGDVVLIHGAAGAVGISAVQQAVQRGARVIGTAGPRNRELLSRFGAEAVAYGPGLLHRVLELAGHVDVALDAVGTDEAVDVSLALVTDRRRIASSAAFSRAGSEGFWIVGYDAGSVEYRNHVRGQLVELAGAGSLIVPVAGTYQFGDAPEALALVASGHAGGKVALLVQ